MVLPALVWSRGTERELARCALPLAGRGDGEAGESGRPLEIELGFGKGRYLVGRAAAQPGADFLGVEIASKYYRLVRDRARRRGLANLTLVRAEAVFLMATALPRAEARAVHVYHPDPWPKDRHHKRRLFDPETVDLVLGLLEPGGRLFFATDFLEYGDVVTELLESHPALDVETVDGWPEGPRTNYEAKFVARGQPITRLIATRRGAPDELLHPAGRAGVVVAPRPL